MKQQEITELTKNVAEIVPKGGLEEKLKKGKPLTVKLGIDPTGPDIHLGFTVVLRKLRQFQDFGHKVVLIVGDFTAKIGDPTGRSSTRPILTDAAIKKNASTFKKQALKILDPSPKKLKVRFNGEWLKKLTSAGLIELAMRVTVGQILARRDFRDRMENDIDISAHELFYPVLQAYDSVVIKADVEIGGTDQLFNLLMGRALMQKFGLQPQIALTMPLLVGTDGEQKMSKSYNNYIGVNESADKIYGKTLAMPDAAIDQMIRLTTNLDVDALDAMGPLHKKQALAMELASLYAGKDAARKAAEKFASTFQRHEFPSDAPILKLEEPMTILHFLAKHRLFFSNSEARRKIAEGAIELDGKKVKDPFLQLNATEGETLQLKIGKKRFFRIKS